jgi:hypothetical protein
MAELAIQLTPPRKDSHRATMSSVDFMASPETISSVKRKTSFPSITTGYVKRFRLDPSLVPEDTSISRYHDRVSKLLPGDRLKLQVMIPFEQTWDGVLDRLDSIISNLVTNMEEQRTKLDKQDVALKNLQRRQLDLCVGNAVIEMAQEQRGASSRFLDTSATTACCECYAKAARTELHSGKVLAVYSVTSQGMLTS